MRNGLLLGMVVGIMVGVFLAFAFISGYRVSGALSTVVNGVTPSPAVPAVEAAPAQPQPTLQQTLVPPLSRTPLPTAFVRPTRVPTVQSEVAAIYLPPAQDDTLPKWFFQLGMGTFFFTTLIASAGYAYAMLRLRAQLESYELIEYAFERAVHLLARYTKRA